MSKGNEKIANDDDELEFLPNLLKEPIFDPRIHLEVVGHTTFGDSARKMSLEASTSSREYESDNIDIEETFSTEQTFSESQGRNSGRDGGEKSSQKKVRPKKKRKLSSKILTDN